MSGDFGTETAEFESEVQVAARLGMKRNTLAGWRVHGCGPRYIKVGRYVRYRRADVDAWLAERTIEGGR